MNKPSFLIGQGRISAVITMKPPEVMGLIEEASGTEVYEETKVKIQARVGVKAKIFKGISQMIQQQLQPEYR